MKIEPRIAIACRDRVEIAVALQMLEKADIRWRGGHNATQAPASLESAHTCRLYVFPSSTMLWGENPDDFTGDDKDGFEWNYVEAADMFRNQLISIRRAKS
jgi:hypothetical protein